MAIGTDTNRLYRSLIMADAPPAIPSPVARKPVSEALLNEKVRCIPSCFPHRVLQRALRCCPVTGFSSLFEHTVTPSLCLEDLTNLPSLPQWDHAISSLLIRSSLGLSFGVVFSVLLFKRRAWPAWVGLGFGAGRAWEEADGRTSSYAVYIWGWERLMDNCSNVQERRCPDREGGA